MASILFIQNLYYQNMGPMYISSLLKENGHNVKMLMTNNLRSIAKIPMDVDIVAFSCTTGAHIPALVMAREIKLLRPKIFIIMGGAHPTFFPEILTRDSPLDAICRGEGESAMLELCRYFPDISRISRINGLWVKIDNYIQHNHMMSLCNLDELPFPDRHLYGKEFFGSVQPVLSSRGCPYNCTFCFNNAFRNMLNAETEAGYYVRYRHPDNTIGELHSIKRISKVIQFRDESFLSNGEQLEMLMRKYAREIKLPFTCQIRINEVNEEKLRLLKEANVATVYFGIESGNEDIRLNIINKRLKTENIYKGVSLLHKYKIPFRTYNIIGLPHETIEDVYATIRLNQKIKTAYPWVSLLTPYKGTEIYKYFVENNTVEKINDPDNSNALEFFFPRSKYYMERPELVNLHNFFIILVRYPSCMDLVKWLIKFSPNVLFRMIYITSYGYASFRSENEPFTRFIKRSINSLRKFSYGPF